MVTRYIPRRIFGSDETSNLYFYLGGCKLVPSEPAALDVNKLVAVCGSEPKKVSEYSRSSIRGLYSEAAGIQVRPKNIYVSRLIPVFGNTVNGCVYKNGSITDISVSEASVQAGDTPVVGFVNISPVGSEYCGEVSGARLRRCVRRETVP